MQNLRKQTRRLLSLLACALLLGICASAAAATELNGYYEGDDGGVYFIRQIGDKVYWFGEDPNGVWANVLMGSVSGNKITAHFWDVPKGKTKGMGEVTLEIQGDGVTLARLSSTTPFGTKTLTKSVAHAVVENGLPVIKGLPPELRSRPQGFSDPAQSLTGVWEGDDYAAYYVREAPNGDVVWVAENGFWGGPGGYAQPAFTHVFFGKKGGPSISGQWIDLPKGKEVSNGTLTVTIKSDQDMQAIAKTGTLHMGALWRSLPNSLRGFADLHTHPMVNLGFGGKLIEGGPDVGSLLPADSDCNHNVRAKSIGQALGKDNATHGGANLADVFGGKNNPCGDSFRELFHDVFQMANHADNTPTNAVGYPSFKDWPRWDDISHQKMWVDWIRRSYDGGQRVMVALAVHNSTLAAAASGPGDGPNDDQTSADLQIAEMKKFFGRHNDFMEIAYTAADLRRIIAANKMAIILGIEIDHIGNFNKFPIKPMPDTLVTAEIKRLFDEGVRYIFPIHVLDNEFGGTAVYEDLFNYSNRRESGNWWDLKCATYDDEINYHFAPFLGDDVPKEIKDLGSALSGSVKLAIDLNAPKPPACQGTGHKNGLGLTKLGTTAIKEMMKLGMLIDIDHMSQKSANETLDIAEAVFNKYPLVSGHNNLRSLATKLPPNEKDQRQPVSPTENSRTDEQLRRIGKLGGMFGLGSAGVDADSWAQRYVAASQFVGRGRVSFGTDLNGLVKGAMPYNGVNIYTAYFPMSKTGDRSFDYRKDGVAHYGMMADFLRDMSLKQKNGEYVRGNIMDNAEYFARMWEKAESNSKNVK